MLEPDSHHSHEIITGLEECLLELETISVPVPVDGEIRPLNLIDSLNETPRSGKQVRIAAFNLELPVQSHTDHLRAVALIAEITAEGYPLTGSERRFISRAVGYHDLSEVIGYDEPLFTSAELKQFSPGPRCTLTRSEANDLIGQRMPEGLRAEFFGTLDALVQEANPANKIFTFADKIEPILAVWRYLRCFHDAIEIEPFIDALKDFFENPSVIAHCSSDRQREAVSFFQSKDNAALYFDRGAEQFPDKDSSLLSRQLLLKVVEKLDMHSVVDSAGR